jgi:uncharacterized protein YbcI
VTDANATGGRPDDGLEREISRQVVSIFKSHTGRGPVRAECTVTETFACILLAGGLTKIEVALNDQGRGATVDAMRRDFQTLMRQDLRVAIERATGRKVKTFLSDHDIDQDVAVEILVFENLDIS